MQTVGDEVEDLWREQGRHRSGFNQGKTKRPLPATPCLDSNSHAMSVSICLSPWMKFFVSKLLCTVKGYVFVSVEHLAV
jgi:hypothetical protein